MPRHSTHRNFGAEHGVVIVMVLIIALVLTMGATAFMVLSNVETRALKYKTYTVRAEIAADSGLSQAIATIDTINAKSNLILTQNYVWDFDTSSKYMDKLNWDTEIANTGQPPTKLSVQISDMERRIHTNYKTWGLASDSLRTYIYDHISESKIDPSAPGMDDLLIYPWHAFGEFVAACKQLATPVDLSSLRPYFTSYPVNPTRSRININTAPQRVVEAIVNQIPSLDTQEKKDAVVNRLLSKRPFADRKALEAAIASTDAAIAPQHTMPLGEVRGGTGPLLDEATFNDLLNSLNGPSNPDPTSEYSSQPGIDALSSATAHYEVDFDPNPLDPPPPPQTFKYSGGQRDATTEETWGCEVMFRSRYYEITVDARVWHLGTKKETSGINAGKFTARPVRMRLIAVYDSNPSGLPQERNVIWRQWQFLGDMEPYTPE